MQHFNSLFTILVCIGNLKELWSAPQPNPLMSTFLLPPPLRSHPQIRYRHSYPYMPGRGPHFRSGRNEMSAQTAAVGEYPYHYQDEGYQERPPAGFSHISETEESYSPSHNNDNYYHHVSETKGNNEHGPYISPPMKLFLLTSLFDNSQQYQVVLIKHPKNGRKHYGMVSGYRQVQHYPEHVENVPKRNVPAQGYNYPDQLKQSPIHKYGMHREDAKSSLGFDSKNNNYAPSMLHQNYEVRFPKTHQLANDTEILSPFMYAPNMNYRYYGVGATNATTF